MPEDEPLVEPEAPRRPVWKVYVPSDELMVGASRYIVIEQETGDILADSKFGE